MARNRKPRQTREVRNLHKQGLANILEAYDLLTHIGTLHIK